MGQCTLTRTCPARRTAMARTASTPISQISQRGTVASSSEQQGLVPGFPGLDADEIPAAAGLDLFRCVAGVNGFPAAAGEPVPAGLADGAADPLNHGQSSPAVSA